MNEFAIDRFLNWLDGYINYERVPNPDAFSLDSIRFLADVCGSPEKTFNSVHVAGSKGKGSVSVMTASILKEAGFKTGLYTSPHIIDFSERVGMPDAPLPEDIYERASSLLMKTVSSIPPEAIPGKNGLTWFELVTAFAFLCFKLANVSWAVFETGMGGRLDATNILRPRVSVITAIELEHTEYLGDTLEKIAGEKAGIIKHETPVCIARQQETVKEVFRTKARENDAPIYFMDEVLKDVSSSMTHEGMNVALNFGDFKLPGADKPLFKSPITARIPMIGTVQALNAALAAFTVKTLFPEMDEDIIGRGLASARLPGRFEILKDLNATIVLDGAHTVESIKLTVNTFTSLWHGPALLLFACAADKNAESIARLFPPSFGKVRITKPGSVKKTDMNKVSKAFSDAFSQYGIIPDVEEDYELAVRLSIEEAIRTQTPLLITGSFYLVSEVKKYLIKSGLKTE